VPSKRSHAQLAIAGLDYCWTSVSCEQCPSTDSYRTFPFCPWRIVINLVERKI
jgi:hypothetical protein